MTDAMGESRLVTAFFDDRSSAEIAMSELSTFGLSADRMRLVPGNNDGDVEDDEQTSSGGFLEALKDMFMPDGDRQAYAEGLNRGGYLLTVTADQDNYEQVLEILDEEGTVDMNERESSWRSEGWNGNDQSADTPAASSSSNSRETSMPQGTQSEEVDDEEVIPAAEEELRVGKRDVSHGRVRVRSYVVEEPVQESVNLRQENVNIERRPIDRSLQGNDEIFRERTIEVEERGEEAVVSKDARVTEELIVSKDVDERTEEVSDTVRRTKVEVEDEREPQRRKVGGR
jgi:uncharacterized protein (TIGR02271 family)